jgi:outer membrane protein assembly factor BamB
MYRTLFNVTAKKLLNDAITTGDQALFDDVTQRFLYTEAGAEAAERLGTLHLDRGRFIVAARAFEKLIQREGLEKLEPVTLFKAALAFHRAGDKDNKDRVWQYLATRSPDGLRLSDQLVNLDELSKLLDKYRPSVVASAFDYPQFGGNESRSAQAVGGAPFMVRRWAQPLTLEGQVKSWLFDEKEPSAVKQLLVRGQAVLPGLYPIAATIQKGGQPHAVLVFRSYGGISAVDLKNGKLDWMSPSSWSFDRMLHDSLNGKQQALNQFISFYKDQTSKPNVLLENSTIGSLSTDNLRVYAVEDLAVPPGTNQNDPRFGMFPRGGPMPGFSQAVTEAIQHNKLHALNLSSGKLMWELGGHRSADEPAARDSRDLRDSYFLGPPLCLGGKLYFLNERRQELRLVCYDPNRLPERPTAQDLQEAVVWIQTLCTAKDKILQDYGRRIHAAHIAFGEGILVCPTNAGVLLGVDVLSHSLVWAHAYRDPGTASTDSTNQPGFPGRVIIGGRFGRRSPQPTTRGDWKSCAPIIQEGKVVFTSPDGNEVRCLNLRNGAKVWGQKRHEEDLYLAGVFAGRVLIVGKKSVRALSLEDGNREVWRVETGGMPSGRGVASDNVYYLPLREAAFPDKDKAPAVVAIDIEKGRLVAQTRSRSKEVPGNLVFFEGDVISQNAMEVVAYPQLKVKLEQMNELLAKNPHDPAGLFERGELRLDQGNRLGAVEDLREVLASKPPDELAVRTRSKMYEALTELLQHDFNKGEKYLKDYEQLCRVEVDPQASPDRQAELQAEGQRRKANYLALYARGREGQGKLVEAFNAYQEFAALGAQTQELLSVVDEPSVRASAEVWAQGRIAALVSSANPEQRRPLEEAIVGKWTEVKDAADVEKLRHFVTLFGSSLPIACEARLHLAQRLMAREGKADLLDAERHLILLVKSTEDSQLGARAVDALAQLLTRKGLLEDAAHYYRMLKDHYAQVVVREGKTGAQVHGELFTDKRFIPYLEESTALAKSRKIRAVEETGTFPAGNQQTSYFFDAPAEQLPFFQRHRLALNYQTNQFRLLDRRSGDEKWTETLKPTNFHYYWQLINNHANNNNNRTAMRFAYQTVGHLIVLNLGQVVVGLDPVNHKVLWERTLLGDQGLPANSQPNLDPADGTLELNFTDGYAMKIGQGGPVAASYVCLQSRDGLMALDPLTGRTLWTRSDVPPRCRIFGDAAHVYLVEMDASNVPTSTRAFRAQDGASVSVVNCASQYQQRLRVLGRVLLLSETTADGLTLKLYDVATAKDVWSRTFPPSSVVLRSEEPDLAGVISPDGRATVISLRSQKEILVGLIDPKDLERLQQAYLLADDQNVYVGCHTQNAQRNPWSNMNQPNFQPGSGVRSIPINGAVYAFDRTTSKIRWVASVQSQQLVLEQWKDLPFLLFSSRYFQAQGAPGRWVGMQEYVGVEAYQKTTGRTVIYRPNLSQQIQQFYALNNDSRSGKIELIGHNYKVTFSYVDQATAGENSGKDRTTGTPLGRGEPRPPAALGSQ